MTGSRTLTGLAATVGLAVLGACGAASQGHGARAGLRGAASSPAASGSSSATRHYLYVFVDRTMAIYDADHRHRLVQVVSLPGVTGVRGVSASPRSHTLYVSHGEDRGPGSHGSLLALDLLTSRVLWDRTYPTGIDSMAIDGSGSRIYMPDGELSPNGTWNVIDAGSGRIIGHIDGGAGPHNTVVGLSGSRVYLGGRNNRYLDVASTATRAVSQRIGPLRSGVRPFTINGAETLAYTTATGFLGFQVSSVRSGRVLYTEGFGPHFPYHPASFAPSAPSHGISLSPDERRLWVVDAPNGYVHVFDVSGVPRRAPRQIADIRLSQAFTGSQSDCSYDCARDGWLLHSRNGCFVYVGDSGEVISTVSLRPVAVLPTLRNSREYLEIDWRQGRPVATTSRTGLGYAGPGHPSSPPRCR